MEAPVELVGRAVSEGDADETESVPYDSRQPPPGDVNVTLWQFLLELLASNQYAHVIQWTSRDGEFQLLKAEEVARLWGMRKNKNSRMNYDKLSRALRYYYQKNIIKKVQGQKFVYRFVGVAGDAGVRPSVCTAAVDVKPNVSNSNGSIINGSIINGSSSNGSSNNGSSSNGNISNGRNSSGCNSSGSNSNGNCSSSNAGLDLRLHSHESPRSPPSAPPRPAPPPPPPLPPSHSACSCRCHSDDEVTEPKVEPQDASDQFGRFYSSIHAANMQKLSEHLNMQKMGEHLNTQALSEHFSMQKMEEHLSMQALSEHFNMQKMQQQMPGACVWMPVPVQLLARLWAGQEAAD